MSKPKLTIGMATYDDAQGVWFSCQSLRLHHAEAMKDVEILIVDNNPTSEQGKINRDMISWLNGLSSLWVGKLIGVLGKEDPELLQKLLDASRSEEQAGYVLFDGIKYDNGKIPFALVNDVVTHRSQEVRDLVQQIRLAPPIARYVAYTQVKGTSAPRNQVFEQARGNAVLCMDSHIMFPPGSIKRLIDFYDSNPDTEDLFHGPMLYDNHYDMSTLFTPVWGAEMEGQWGSDGRGGNPDEPPFEIEAQGLGIFSCRRKAWLGFNPNFRGFGGEEWYIHRKYRKAGHKVFCLPFLRWLHRFIRVGGVPYPLMRWHKVRNYILGRQELGLPLDDVYDHFVKTGLTSQAEWDGILAGQIDPPGAAGACGSCGGAATPATLESWFNKSRDQTSDINEHVATLRALSSSVHHVTEFGVRQGVSTVALLSGQPDRLVSYDLSKSAEVGMLEKLAGKTKFDFMVGDSRTVEIEDTDMLFIDTKHTAGHVKQELDNHHQKVRAFIVLHDTVTFGEHGEDGGPGLLPALRMFLREHPEWTVKKHLRNNNGLMILTRLVEDKKVAPPLWRKAMNYTAAMAKHVQAGGGRVALEVFDARMDTCAICESRNNDLCAECGCPIEAKSLIPSSECPIGKWFAAPTIEVKKEGAA